MKTIADRIKYCREELELSQEQLAKRMGYAARTSVSNMESSGDDISLKKVRKFAKALNVSEAYLLGLEEEDEPALYTDNDLDLLDKYKSLSMDNQKRVIKLIELLSQVDGIKVAVDTDVLDVYISEEGKRKESKIKMIKAMKTD